MATSSEVWAYIRVSSEQQADQGLPVAGQREAIVEYAKRHGWTVSRFYVDEGISGTTDDREQFQLMLADAATDRPTAILLWSWSRFARNENDAMFHKASLRRQGIEIHTIQDDFPRSTASRRASESLIHWRGRPEEPRDQRQARRGQQTHVRMGYIPRAVQRHAVTEW